MEQGGRNVLFIDDHCSQLIISLEPVASVMGFNLYTTDNVLDGLAFLKEYACTIEAVVLDIGFPQSEMQGVEALVEIKKQHKHMPVIMLTDSDKATDLELVVACMKKGAYNYIGKKNLNPVYFFQVLENALQQNNLAQYIKGNKQTTQNDKFYTIIENFSHGRNTKRALFGFDLKSIIRPANENEIPTLRQYAVNWHHNILKSISTPFHDSIQINLKYIVEKGKITFRIIFSLFADDDDIITRKISDIQYDLQSFFYGSDIDKSNPYLFENINEAGTLIDSLQHSPDFSYSLFLRNPLKVKDHTPIGFRNVKKAKNSSQENKKEYPPDELFPLPQKLTFENELFKALVNQQHFTEIDVQLTPKQLFLEEIELLQRVAKNPQCLDGVVLSQEESELFSAYLKKFIDPAHDIYIISVLLKHKGETIQQHLKTALHHYFFGKECSITTVPLDPDKVLPRRFYKQDYLNQLPIVYDEQNAVQSFRFPFPEIRYFAGIVSEPVYFRHIPKNLPHQGILLGEKKIMNGKIPIRINEDSLARHLYIMGQTGTGKSTLLKTMITDCLQKKHGFALIDPHGDLYDEVQKFVPKILRKKVIVLNVTDPTNSARHNPLGYDKNNPQSKSLAVNELIRIFDSLYNLATTGGPIFELYFKNGLLLVLDEKVQTEKGFATVQNIVDVFYKSDYRDELLKICGNQRVRDFFSMATKTTGEVAFNNFGPYITSKLIRFTEDYYITPIITCQDGNINYRALIDEGNILLVKLDKGLIGTDNVSLLGQMVISSIVMAAMSRINLKKETRKPFYLFIDEFQNFIKGDIGSALSEVRKYGLSLTLANQTLGQLEQNMVEALMGNVGSMIFFRPGINDYEKIKHYLEPEFVREDILKLPNFNCIARLLIDNVPCDPFVFQNKYE